MNTVLKNLIMAAFLCFLMINETAIAQYGDYKTISARISTLCSQYPSLCSSGTIAATAGGMEIRVLTIGTGDKDNKPAIAVVGGVDGNFPAGRELALGFASSILKESAKQEVRELLEKITFYVIPDASPDASEQFFSPLRYERTVNARATDDDRDFKTDEDPFEDLNKDGLITLVRVQDPSGTWIESKDDKRVMVKADPARGETGSYILFTEGTDNDKDGKYNEDGAGGVSFNRNFTYNYEEYGLNSGLHAMSEPETKGVADFLYDHFNIYTVISFGPQDNLGQPMKASERQPAPSQPGMQPDRGRGSGMEQGDRRITSILRSDETINKLVSDKYHEITGAKGAPATATARGNFMEWAYFHYGRYSFSTPGWWFPVEKGADPAVSFLKFAEKNKMEDVFVPWTEVSHPDFPGKRAEVGGIKPFAMTTPPVDTLESLIEANYRFIREVAGMHPELEFLDIKTEDQGEGVARISLKLHNKGIFATCAEIGDNNQWTRIMRITLQPSKEQELLSGQKVQRVRRLEGGQSTEYSWLVYGKGQVKITAGALNSGTVTSVIELK